MRRRSRRLERRMRARLSCPGGVVIRSVCRFNHALTCPNEAIAYADALAAGEAAATVPAHDKHQRLQLTWIRRGPRRAEASRRSSRGHRAARRGPRLGRPAWVEPCGSFSSCGLTLLAARNAAGDGNAESLDGRRVRHRMAFRPVAQRRRPFSDEHRFPPRGCSQVRHLRRRLHALHADDSGRDHVSPPRPRRGRGVERPTLGVM